LEYVSFKIGKPVCISPPSRPDNHTEADISMVPQQ